MFSSLPDWRTLVANAVLWTAGLGVAMYVFTLIAWWIVPIAGLLLAFRVPLASPETVASWLSRINQSQISDKHMGARYPFL